MTTQLVRNASPSQTGRHAPAVKLAGQWATHHTIDELNRDDLEAMAAVRGLRIDHYEPRDGQAAGPTVVFDADYYWTSRAEREQGIRDLLDREVRPAVVFVYGRQLEDDQVERLEAAGIKAFPRLDEMLVDALVKAVARLPVNISLADRRK